MLRVAAVVVALFALIIALGVAMGLFSGTRPDNLGVHDGRLAPPKRTPNNVNSQIDKTADAEHYIEPLRYTGDARRAWAALRRVVDGMQRVKVVKSEPDYLHAEFSSKLMGFVDDTEFYLDEKAGVIQVRSASRLGRRDFGVNRERIEHIRAALARAKP
ncbi:MAG: DUF1499 domain-containing protein [Burkholderiales bacterium]|nr:DUF1499 domain-containing protein [Burkholderiales bacterium]